MYQRGEGSSGVGGSVGRREGNSVISEGMADADTAQHLSKVYSVSQQGLASNVFPLMQHAAQLNLSLKHDPSLAHFVGAVVGTCVGTKVGPAVGMKDGDEVGVMLGAWLGMGGMYPGSDIQHGGGEQ